MSKLRFKHIVRARSAAIWLVWWKYNKSYHELARTFGVDHTTAWAAIGRHLDKCGGEIANHWSVPTVKRKNMLARDRQRMRTAAIAQTWSAAA